MTGQYVEGTKQYQVHTGTPKESFVDVSCLDKFGSGHTEKCLLRVTGIAFAWSVDWQFFFWKSKSSKTCSTLLYQRHIIGIVQWCAWDRTITSSLAMKNLNFLTNFISISTVFFGAASYWWPLVSVVAFTLTWVWSSLSWSETRTKSKPSHSVTETLRRSCHPQQPWPLQLQLWTRFKLWPSDKHVP